MMNSIRKNLGAIVAIKAAKFAPLTQSPAHQTAVNPHSATLNTDRFFVPVALFLAWFVRHR
ncbi:hypothetical protein [Citrobacter freundii]|uniref:hypothetical protein n=1 Tax=Citrobacter freundii TaxID=546 RepID=UPI0021E10E51|nr:hypothetical protein [Citrobacter freundii]EKV4663477.1 hypothetical protein [Citrobacter freundii]EKW2232879.1 hypothetical protein [Citrobacter freundii]HCJ6188823.1 hypothetical protein [Citrobacter freundii]